MVQLAAAASTQSESSIASPLMSKDSSAVVTPITAARELIFQELSSQLFQTSGATASDSVSSSSVAAERLTADDLNGLIRVVDEPVVDEDEVAQDAVLRELDAVDAVLSDLHNLDLLLPSAANIEIPLSLDLEFASDRLLGGEIDGGMVLLQATGDPNANVFAATPADLEQLATTKPAKMEVAIGMFQALDVAVDEAPRIESAPPTSASSAAARDSKLNESLSREHEQASASKAAVAIGATTLTGALVWANRQRSREGRRIAAAQNRRASRAE